MNKIVLIITLLIAITLVSCNPKRTTTEVEATKAATSTPSFTILPNTPTISPTATTTPRPRIRAGDNLGFLKGMNYVSWAPTNYGHPLSDLSLKALADTGTKWVSLNVSGEQINRSATTIDTHIYDDAGVIHAIQTAHNLDMNVMLKISVVFSSDPTAWGGSIGEGFSPADWDAWFASYTELVLYYTKLAKEHNVEIICIGTEMGLAQMQTKHFTQLVADVRQIFPGPVTYAADWSEPETDWWDQVDYIGIDGYYWITKKSSPSLAELEAGWQPIVAELEALSKKWNKPLIFTEIGFNAQEYSACNGGCGMNMEAAQLGKLDPKTQENAYQALFNVFRDKDWFQGTFWWMWDDSVYAGGMCNPQYTPKGKLAENVLRAEYGGAPAILTYPAALPVFDESSIVQFPIFTDEFGDVNPEGGWDIKTDIVSSPVYMGTQALKFDVQGNGGFSAFLPPLDTSPYQWLEFFIYVESDVGTSVSVTVSDPNWQEYYFTDLTHCNYFDNQSALVIGQWNRILIPLEEIAADQRILNSITIKNSSRDRNVFWVDQIRFVGLK